MAHIDLVGLLLNVECVCEVGTYAFLRIVSFLHSSTFCGEERASLVRASCRRENHSKKGIL